jgi:diguanylate cyclase (GGDEF)-like protein
MWPLISKFRSSCEILQAPDAKRAAEHLSELGVPNLLIVQSDLLSTEEIGSLSHLALSRSVPWAVAALDASAQEETAVLSLGAVEYLPVTEKSEMAQARLERIMQDRFSVQRDQEIQKIDPLTELPNRSALLERLQLEWKKLNQETGTLALIAINIKGFKAYNKSHGYLSGDQCLGHLALLFKTMLQPFQGYLVRFSGNEFAILLRGCQEAQVIDLSENIRQTVRAAKINNRTADGGLLSVRVGHHIYRSGDKGSTYEFVDIAFQKLK